LYDAFSAELDGLFKRTARFRQQIQVNADKAKEMVDGGIGGFKLTRVRQWPRRPRSPFDCGRYAQGQQALRPSAERHALVLKGCPSLFGASGFLSWVNPSWRIDSGANRCRGSAS
jgi:hypothetical protein